MEVMLAYDHSRNSRIALEAVKQLFAKELPMVTLISVIEEPGSNTSAGDEMFEAQYQERSWAPRRPPPNWWPQASAPRCWWPRATPAR